MNYDFLIDMACQEGLTVKEKPFQTYDGRIKGKNIYIRKDMTPTEKACVLAEELGHHYTTVGDILDQDVVGNRKQELRARLWAYNEQIGLRNIIRAYEAHLTEFLSDALQCYRNKYSPYTTVDNYIIFFEPCLSAVKLI